MGLTRYGPLISITRTPTPAASGTPTAEPDTAKDLNVFPVVSVMSRSTLGRCLLALSSALSATDTTAARKQNKNIRRRLRTCSLYPAWASLP